MSRAVHCGKILFAVAVSVLFAALCLTVFSAPQAYADSPLVDILIEDGAGGSDLTKVYDGRAITLTARANSNVPGMTYTYQWYKDGNPVSDATDAVLALKQVEDSGDYICKVNQEGVYYGGSAPVRVAITHKPVTLAFSGVGADRIYKKSQFSIMISVDGAVAGDDVRYDQNLTALTKDGNAINDCEYSDYHITLWDNAGAYSLTVSGITGADADNYALISEPYIFSIGQREITLHFAGANRKVYDGEPFVIEVTAGNTLEDVPLDVSGNGAFAAGTHTLTVNAVNNPNYKLPAVRGVTYTIEKAKPVITVGAPRYVFAYDGEPHEIDYNVTLGQTVYKSPEYVFPFTNYFVDAGTYDLFLKTKESDNYAASDAVFVRVEVLETYFYEGSNRAVIENGADPFAVLDSGLVLDRSSVEHLFQPRGFEEKVAYIYYASLMLDGEPVENPGKMTLLFHLPAKYAGLQSVSLIYLKNGVYVQESLPVTNGSITFTMDGPGNFALVDNKNMQPRVLSDENLGLAIAIAATIAVLALILAIVLALVTRSKYALTVYKPQYRAYGNRITGDDLPKNSKGWYKNNTMTKPLMRIRMPAKDLILYSGFDASDFME